MEAELIAALNRMAAALESQALAITGNNQAVLLVAEGITLLARATAGEFDEQEAVPELAPKGRGMGMG